MDATLKFVQLNIEASKHLNLVIPFLRERNADAITLQELMERDVEKFEHELGMKCVFAPQAIQNGGVQGIGIFSKWPVTSQRIEQYGGIFSDEIPEYVHDEANRMRSYTSSRFVLLIADIEKEGTNFRIATTHFPVSVGGLPTDFQRQDVKRMLSLLEKEGECICAGDFNAPRGGEIFSALAAKYKDNIPQEITMSVDGSIHRAGEAKLLADAKAQGLSGIMVDGIFSTPGYLVSNVEMHTGLSDHCAFSAEISKIKN